MKTIAIIASSLLLFGCVAFHNATPPGDNSPRHASEASDFAGVYANSGVEASSRPQPPLTTFLFHYFSSKLERADRVALRFPDADTLEIEVRNGSSVVEIKRMRQGIDYIFGDSMIVFEASTDNGRSGSEAFPSTALRSYRRAMWLNQAGELVAENKRSAAGVAMGVIPGGGYTRNVWRWKKVEEWPNAESSISAKPETELLLNKPAKDAPR